MVHLQMGPLPQPCHAISRAQRGAPSSAARFPLTDGNVYRDFSIAIAGECQRWSEVERAIAFGGGRTEGLEFGDTRRLAEMKG